MFFGSCGKLRNDGILNPVLGRDTFCKDKAEEGTVMVLLQLPTMKYL